eukprot:16433635-Heterocapsa_arctica.AAC.1
MKTLWAVVRSATDAMFTPRRGRKGTSLRDGSPTRTTHLKTGFGLNSRTVSVHGVARRCGGRRGASRPHCGRLHWEGCVLPPPPPPAPPEQDQ